MQVVFPLEFQNLRLSDIPDLIDYDVQLGIEVIHPVDEKHEMLNSYYYSHLCGKTMDQISTEGLKIFQSHSYDIMLDSQNQTISAYKKPYEPFNIETIYRAIDKKIKKLNSNLYSNTDNISLYLEMAMCSIESANYSVAEKILDYAKEARKNTDISFKEIFYDCIMNLYRINLTSGEITEIDIRELTNLIDLKYEENRIKIGDTYDQL